MPDILHRMIIPADVTQVFDLIASPAGLKHWWTQDASGGGEVGEIIELGFNGRKAIIQFRVDEVVMDKKIVWSCTANAGGMEEWPGTRLVWHLAPWKTGGTDVRFGHIEWQVVTGEYPACNTLWGQLLLRLKSAAVGQGQGAMFY